MKVAYFSPLPPQRTGIADYSRELLPALVKCAEIDLWVDQPVTAAELPDCTTYKYAEEPGLRAELSKYDCVIYHMGNSPAHRNVYRTLLETPGVVVLHDFVLHHFFASYYLEALRSPGSYIDEMAYNYGSEGEELARTTLRGERPIWEQEPVRYPLNKRVLDHARGVIVHSDFAGRLVHQSHPHLPVMKVNMPVAISQASAQPDDLKKQYGIPAGRIVIASMGFGSPAKRIEMVLRAIGALDRNDIVYLLVGEVGEALRVEMRRRGLGGLVRTTGYVDRQTFNDYCNLIDLGIDLRYPTMGETSASVCRMLGAGKPCVVSNLGWFAELPDDCAVKLDAAADEQVLARTLLALINDPPRRSAIGENARRYIREHHNPECAAAQYVDFLGEVRSVEKRRALERSIIAETGRAMAEIGVGAEDSWLVGGVAAEIAALFKPVKVESDDDTG
jgi:glycosyltransferase involved in cell wall biosynthesis